MECEGCGAEAVILKTVRWRTGDRRFTLCDPCHSPLVESLWIVRGREIAAARCDSCGHWLHPGDMTELRKGAKWDGFGGVCLDCSR
ncbi:MAG: hypothetical protein AVDCRST_MAG93-3003 [uncultured Chloroflexia bacterium]|uniref:Uncharacterized protein n=1 Tax=uncultured Chloroflexia bacterium TaxID=1672391 RepID=A0A6J4JFW1_9CHLR|nr:MAG: hypothetical protein AVDCRST_MAG93-3003 [uncultured Chloroflexia bacterium]